MRATSYPLLAAALIVALAVMCSPAQAVEVYPLIEFDHTSDAMRGKAPWAEDVSEPVQDYVGIGATLAIGKRGRFELDLTHGRKLFTGTLREVSPVGWQSGSKVRVRFYPRGR